MSQLSIGFSVLAVKLKLLLLAYKAPGDLALAFLSFFVTFLSPPPPLHSSQVVPLLVQECGAHSHLRALH